MRPLLATLTLPLLTSPAFAAEPEKGMPQLDFANPMTVAQVVWGAVIFFALYRLLAGWALPQVAQVLEARAAAITGDLEAARAAKERADAAVAEQAEATAKARAAAQGQIAAAVAQAKAVAAEQAAVLNARLDAQLAEAETRIASARAAALGALREVASDTTAAIVTRLTGRVADPSRIDMAVGAALAARGQA